MRPILNHFSTDLNSYRNFVNFSSMGCEQFFKDSPISQIAQKAFVFLNLCLVGKEGGELFKGCRQESRLNREAWGPHLANILNIVAAASSVFYMVGYINTPLFILACSSRIIPYATNFFKGSAYTPLLKKLNSQNGGLSGLQLGITNLNIPLSSGLKRKMEALTEKEERFRSLYHRYENLLNQINDPKTRSRDTITTFWAENQTELLEEMRSTLKIVVEAIDSKDADEEEVLQRAREVAIQIVTRTSLGRLIEKIDTTPRENLYREMQESLKNLRNLDLLIQFGSFLLGIAYVSLLIVYNGVCPYEGLIYLSFFAYNIYEFWKERYVQLKPPSSLSNFKEFDQVGIALQIIKSKMKEVTELPSWVERCITLNQPSTQNSTGATGFPSDFLNSVKEFSITPLHSIRGLETNS